MDFKRMNAEGKMVATTGEKMSETLALFIHDQLKLVIHIPSGLTLFNYDGEETPEIISARCGEVEKLGFDWQAKRYEDWNPRELPVGTSSYLVRILKGELTAGEAVVEELLGKEK